jgi:hypothetical protein
MAEQSGSGLTRRAVLAGLGAATGASALAMAAPAQASVPRQNPGGNTAGKGTSAGLSASASAPTQAVDLKPDLTYVVIAPSAFTNDKFMGGRTLLPPGATADDPSVGAALSAPLLLPVGSELREVIVGYTNPAGTVTAELWKKSLFGNYGRPFSSLDLPPPSDPSGFDVRYLNFHAEIIDGNFSYEITVSLPAAGQAVSGVVLGYLPSAQSFFSLPSHRQYDSRGGGKLQPGEERTIGLGGDAGVPPQARGAVINLTVTETEGAGYVAVFPANQAWNGTSSINWFGPGQNLANSLVTAMDDLQQVTIRGGASPTHVIIDILGYVR